MLMTEAGGGETAAPGSQAAQHCGGWRMREHKLKTVTFHQLEPARPVMPAPALCGSEQQAEARRARPYKVCGGSGGKMKDRKGIVAASFQELVQKARHKFPDAGEDITLVLFEDKTEIDDEEYFQSLEDNTVFLVVPASSNRRGRQKTRNCDKFQEKRQKQKSRQSDSCLGEISKLLAKEGAVTGKGEVIQKGGSRKMVELVNQVDAVTIEFEIDKAENKTITRPRDISFTSHGTTPAPKQLAAQLINKLEKHKKILEKERKSENNVHLLS